MSRATKNKQTEVFQSRSMHLNIRGEAIFNVLIVRIPPIVDWSIQAP
jgi:hypothetical protein